ncbi:MAG: Rrf2 family transcriptional regulator [Gammaproteobacteria bacterium]|nr:Rrf2 family transcriptional regulator [Gammaproteobacteria bacterium]
MQLTMHTDYSLRVLIYLTQTRDSLATISEIAEFYKISRNHLVKVVHHLSSEGFIQTTRGKNGGMKLARSPELISIGDVVRRMEPNFDIVECFNADNPACVVTSVCSLKSALYQASAEFLAVLDRFTLADAMQQGERTDNLFPVKDLRKVVSS